MPRPWLWGGGVLRGRLAPDRDRSSCGATPTADPEKIVGAPPAGRHGGLVAAAADRDPDPPHLRGPERPAAGQARRGDRAGSPGLHRRRPPGGHPREGGGEAPAVDRGLRRHARARGHDAAAPTSSGSTWRGVARRSSSTSSSSRSTPASRSCAARSTRVVGIVHVKDTLAGDPRRSVSRSIADARCARRTSCRRRRRSPSSCASSSAATSGWRSSWTSTAASRASSRSRTCSRRSSARSPTSTRTSARRCRRPARAPTRSRARRNIAIDPRPLRARARGGGVHDGRRLPGRAGSATSPSPARPSASRDLRFTVEEADRRRVHRVRVEMLESSPEESQLSAVASRQQTKD